MLGASNVRSYIAMSARDCSSDIENRRPTDLHQREIVSLPLPLGEPSTTAETDGTAIASTVAS